MKKTAAGLVVVLYSVVVSHAAALGTAFTYQGRLTDSGSPASSTYDLQFYLATAAVAGSQIGNVLTNDNVAVSNGLFTVDLDFGTNAFTGEALWLNISVRPGASTGAFTPLSPRQSLQPAPYSSYALNAGIATLASGAAPGSITSVALASGAVANADIASDAVTSDKIANGAVVVTDLSSAVLSNTFWRLSGNAGTTAATFIGTTDNQPVRIRVNNSEALRIERTLVGANLFTAPNSVGTNLTGSTVALGYANTVSDNVSSSSIGGGQGNVLGAGVFGAVIGGGLSNTNASGQAVIAGGFGNLVATNAGYAVISGGDANRINSGALRATIAGGASNGIQTNASASTISGGQQNVIQTNAVLSTIAGGYQNTVWADASYATIGGGWQNDIGTASGRSTIAGGDANTIESNAWWGAIGGGFGNTIRSNAWEATIPGGSENAAAADYTFAAGRRAKANHQGAFVWGDSTTADIASTNGNSVTMRAGGGYRLFSNGGATLGVYLASNGGSWTSISDRNAKDNIEPVNARALLDKVAALPVSTWNYRSQTNGVRHIGPMAQDFKAAFGVGETDTGITTIDADGVALAAIQGLNRKLEAQLKEKDTRIAALEASVTELREAVSRLLADRK